MRSTTQVMEDLNRSTKDLIDTIREFPPQSFNTKPDTNRWSAGEISQHLLKTELGTLQIIKEDVTDLERDPAKKIANIKTEFLNFTNKFAAFAPILPDDSPQKQSEMVDKFTSLRKKFAELTVELNLGKRCLAFGHPLFGVLSRLEWIYFSIFHAQRHTHQMNELRHQLTHTR